MRGREGGGIRVGRATGSGKAGLCPARVCETDGLGAGLRGVFAVPRGQPCGAYGGEYCGTLKDVKEISSTKLAFRPAASALSRTRDQFGLSELAILLRLVPGVLPLNAARRIPMCTTVNATTFSGSPCAVTRLWVRIRRFLYTYKRLPCLYH
ncbi:hypothetical protein EJ06DRAFT_133696 [Trichodelitschia bisporula]|uniref:Uncharacterized protein n=1 Tax=Trichodelitschia bisporula TaxID=703511 RepID=A0A6G1HNS2_9PEZI|nr:hypothetical protein EJ06DRAFT_133696 [Trichodelitschia bisporula]